MTRQQGPPADYVDVAERIAEFREKHPDGSFQPVDLQKPFEVVVIGDKTFVVYAAAAYRTPDDPRPGVGLAYEPFPGPTPFTRDSELQNAETAAWGRAIVAALAADTKRGVTSADEVRGRISQQDEDDEHTRLLEQLDGLLPKLPEDKRDAAWAHAEKGVPQAQGAIERAMQLIAEPMPFDIVSDQTLKDLNHELGKLKPGERDKQIARMLGDDSVGRLAELSERTAAAVQEKLTKRRAEREADEAAKEAREAKS